MIVNAYKLYESNPKYLDFAPHQEKKKKMRATFESSSKM